MKTIWLYILLVFSLNLAAQQAKKNPYQTFLEKDIKTIKKSNGDIFLQGSFTDVLTDFTQKNSRNELENQWLKIANAPHPSVKTVRKYLKNAALEFNVPFELLDAIAKTYNNYAMIGPSEYGSWGIMGLVQNSYCNNLKQAAELINVNPEKLKSDFKENIRGAAALIARFQQKYSKNPEDWFNALKEYSGMIDNDLKEMQAIDYYRTLNQGATSITLWKEEATVVGIRRAKIHEQIANYDKKLTEKIEQSKVNVDYPGAVAEFTSCNYSSRGGTDINCWVNHYIGTGTVAGALSWFKNCNAKASAHFTISRYGTIYQSVKVYSKAWHAGASGQSNNERSIGVEHDATAANPQTWNMTSMLKPSAEMAAHFCDLYNIPKVRKYRPNYGAGICGHNDMPGTNTSCPGSIPWSIWFDFLEGETDNTPEPQYPAKNASDISIPISFNWNSPVGANAFRIQVSKSNSGWTESYGFTSATSPNGTVVVNASITSDSYNWLEGVAGAYEAPNSNTTYYWTVRSWDSETGTSKYSAVRSFTTEQIKWERAWSRADITGNMPSWFSSTNNTERGMAYVADKLYVVSRNGDDEVKVLNAINGSDNGVLSTIGVSGGIYTLNDVETSWDGQILACNLTVDASQSAFKIYKWENNSSNPELYLEFNTRAYRLGDSFTVLGNISQTAVIYAAAASTNKVIRWVVNNGVLGNAEEVTLQGINSIGTAPEVVPYGISANEDFYVNGNTMAPTQFAYDGTSRGSINGGVVAGYSNAMQMVIDGGSRYLVTFQNNPNAGDANSQNVRVIDITNGASNVTEADIYGVTEKMGDNANPNCTGDIAIRKVSNPDDIMIFVLSTNNGIAVYRPVGIVNNKRFTTIADANSSESISFYPNPANNELFINTQEISTELVLEIFNMSGMKELTTIVKDSNTIDLTDLPGGVYILSIQNELKKITKKLIINHN